MMIVAKQCARSCGNTPRDNKRIFSLMTAMAMLAAGAVVLPRHGMCAAESRLIPVSTNAPHASASRANGATNQVETTADVLDYDRKAGVMKAQGHVIVSRGDEELRADYAQVNMKTEDADATGNVVLKKQDGIWKGPRLHYNFKTKTGDAPELVGNMAPFHIEATNTQKVAANEYVMKDALITTCTNQSGYHYHVSADEAKVTPGNTVAAKGAVFYLGPLPIMYMPYFVKDLRDEFGFRFYAGASSTMGPFLLTGYRYRINEFLRGETHLDYRTKRGAALGQDFKWNTPDGSYGDLATYYLNDRAAQQEADDDSADIKNDRYRVRLRDTYNIDSEDYILLQAQYLSDIRMLEDFFEDEYRQSSQPDNYLTYTHRGADYTFNILTRVRLNDFYDSVNRLPEVSLNLSRQQIDDTPFYYEGQTAAAFLQKVWAASETGEAEYSAFRVDSSHMVYYPTKEFDFLNVTPRAGYRATYYSATPDTAEDVVSFTTNYVFNADGSSNAVVSTNTAMSSANASAKLRSHVEVGVETSFKAFKTWESEAGPMRHIVEPYANYTFVPDNTVSPDKLYQFDSVDTLDKLQTLKLGARNKLQTKENDAAVNLIDLDVYTILNIQRTEGQQLFDKIESVLEFTPTDKVRIRTDEEYDVPNRQFNTFNVQMSVSEPQYYTANIEYRYTKDYSTLLSEDTTFNLNRNWDININGRYEFQESQLQEIGGYLQRNLDCMSMRVGCSFIPGYTQSNGTDARDEWRFSLELWLTSFPGSGPSDRNRH